MIYAVIYPFGTSQTFKLFNEITEACRFVDEETNHTNVILPDKQLTIVQLDGTLEEWQEREYSGEDGRSIGVEGMIELFEDEAIEKQTVDYWRVKPNDDGMWVDDMGNIYTTEEEAVEANKPSQYFFKF